MTNSYELQPRYDSRKSFYKKAHVEIDGHESKLFSYGTHVASVFSGMTSSEDVLEVYGTYSATTLRHIKEFAAQFGFGYMTKQEVEKYLTENIGRIQADMAQHARDNIRKEAPWILS